MNNNFYNTNEPFNLEVVITDETKRAEIEDKVLRAVFNKTELIEGLRVNVAYKQSLDRQDVLTSAMKDEFEALMKTTQDAFKKFFDKWDSDEHPKLKGAINKDAM